MYKTAVSDEPQRAGKERLTPAGMLSFPAMFSSSLRLDVFGPNLNGLKDLACSVLLGRGKKIVL